MSTTNAEIVGGYNDQVRWDVLPSIPKGTGTLLDVGGGNGATAAQLKHLGYATRVGSVDLARPETVDPDLDFQLIGNLDDDDFVSRVIAEEGPFDTILCLDVLEHLVDPWGVVAKLHAGLRPGGAIVASLPNVRHYRVSGGLLFGGRWTLHDAGILDRTHLRFFVKETMIELMTSSGLVLEEVRPLPMGRHPGFQVAVTALTFGRLEGLVTVRYLVRVRRADS